MQSDGVLIMRIKLIFPILFIFLMGCDKAIISNEKHFLGENNSKAFWTYSLNELYPDKKVKALAKRAGNGELNEIEQLVNEGVSPNSKGIMNVTPLYWAFRQNNIEGAKKLLQLGANPNIVFENGTSLIHLAARREVTLFLKLFLQHKANPNLVAGPLKITPLFEVISIFGELEKFDEIDLLLEYGADVNEKNTVGDTPILLAAKFGRFDIVHRLLQGKADLKITNNHGENLKDILTMKKEQLVKEHELYGWLIKVELLIGK
jgi:ankyrin repeat protein